MNSKMKNIQKLLIKHCLLIQQKVPKAIKKAHQQIVCIIQWRLFIIKWRKPHALKMTAISLFPSHHDPAKMSRAKMLRFKESWTELFELMCQSEPHIGMTTTYNNCNSPFSWNIMPKRFDEKIWELAMNISTTGHVSPWWCSYVLNVPDSILHWWLLEVSAILEQRCSNTNTTRTPSAIFQNEQQ